MEFYIYTLPNGIRCIHKRVRSSIVHCSLTIGTGSRDELTSEFGMAHLIEHAIFKGTTHRRAYHINSRLENLGGELNAYTTKEETVVHATTLRSDFGKAAELIADIVFHATFPERELSTEKKVILDEIESYKDSPAERIFDDFEDLIFAGSSLGHNILGRKAAITRYVREDLFAFTARTYNTDRMVFASIGNISERRFRETVERYFGSATPSPRSFERDTQLPYHPFDKTVHRNTHQAHCIVGNRAYDLNDERRLTLSLLINLLGGPSANSLLNTSIREKHGLSYNIDASYTPFSDTGVVAIYFGTDKDKVDRCLELLHAEIHKLCDSMLSSRKLSIAKRQFIGQLSIAMESNEGYMLGAGKSLLVYDSVDSMEQIYRRVSDITREEICNVANEIFGSQLSYLCYR